MRAKTATSSIGKQAAAASSAATRHLEVSTIQAGLAHESLIGGIPAHNGEPRPCKRCYAIGLKVTARIALPDLPGLLFKIFKQKAGKVGLFRNWHGSVSERILSER